MGLLRGEAPGVRGLMLRGLVWLMGERSAPGDTPWSVSTERELIPAHTLPLFSTAAAAAKGELVSL